MEKIRADRIRLEAIEAQILASSFSDEDSLHVWAAKALKAFSDEVGSFPSEMKTVRKSEISACQETLELQDLPLCFSEPVSLDRGSYKSVLRGPHEPLYESAPVLNDTARWDQVRNWVREVQQQSEPMIDTPEESPRGPLERPAPVVIEIDVADFRRPTRKPTRPPPLVSVHANTSSTVPLSRPASVTSTRPPTADILDVFSNLTRLVRDELKELLRVHNAPIFLLTNSHQLRAVYTRTELSILYQLLPSPVHIMPLSITRGLRLNNKRFVPSEIDLETVDAITIKY